MQSTVDFEILHAKQIDPLTFYVRDTITGDLIDPVSGSWSLIRISDDSVIDTGTFGPTGSTDITRIDLGIFQYAFDGITNTNEYIFSVKIVLLNEIVTQDIFVKAVSARHFAYASALQLQVDKSRKSIKDDVENMDRSSANFNPSIQFFYGYSAKHLIFYLERGMQFLNAIPPYTYITVDSFPFPVYGTILIDAATIAALESQGVLAIDSDFSYSLGGNNLVIEHYGKLSTHINSILTRFKETAWSWKQLFRTNGVVLYQWGPMAMRTSRLFNVMPSGFYSRLMSTVLQY